MALFSIVKILSGGPVLYYQKQLGASFRFLSAPLHVKDAALAQALRSERINQETLAIAAQAQVVVIGIGTPEPK